MRRRSSCVKISSTKDTFFKLCNSSTSDRRRSSGSFDPSEDCDCGGSSNASNVMNHPHISIVDLPTVSLSPDLLDNFINLC